MTLDHNKQAEARRLALAGRLLDLLVAFSRLHFAGMAEVYVVSTQEDS
jgi:hypothetical protein